MFRRPLLTLSILLLIQVLAFGLLEGTTLRNAGNPVLYFAYWFMRAAALSAPMILLALATRLTARAGSADLSLASAALLGLAVMSLFPASALFWVFAVPLGAAVTIGLTLLSGAIVRRIGAGLLITAGLVVAERMTLNLFTRPLANPPFMLVPGFDMLGEYNPALGLVLIAAVLTMGLLIMRVRPGAVTIAAALVAVMAGLVSAAQDHAVRPAALLLVEAQVLLVTLASVSMSASPVRSAAAALLAALNVAVFTTGVHHAGVRYGFAALSPYVMHGVVIALVLLMMLGRRGLQVRG